MDRIVIEQVSYAESLSAASTYSSVREDWFNHSIATLRFFKIWDDANVAFVWQKQVHWKKNTLNKQFVPVGELYRCMNSGEG